MNLKLKNVLITLAIVAVVLVAITFYVVFYGASGTYVVSSLSGTDAGIFGSGDGSNSATTASSTPSSTLAIISSSSATSSDETSDASSTELSAPSVTWTQGNEAMAIASVAISGTQLTLGVQVTMGSASECVPLTLRMIADEQGDLSPPITPQFTFPDTGTCNGTAGEIYSAQPIVFTLANPGAFPIIFTTGGTANVLFEVIQNPDGSLTAQLPPSSD